MSTSSTWKASFTSSSLSSCSRSLPHESAQPVSTRLTLATVGQVLTQHQARACKHAEVPHTGVIYAKSERDSSTDQSRALLIRRRAPPGKSLDLRQIQLAIVISVKSREQLCDDACVTSPTLITAARLRHTRDDWEPKPAVGGVPTCIFVGHALLVIVPPILVPCLHIGSAYICYAVQETPVDTRTIATSCLD